MRIIKNIFLYSIAVSVMAVSCGEKKDTLFTQLSPSDTHISFKNTLEKRKF